MDKWKKTAIFAVIALAAGASIFGIFIYFGHQKGSSTVPAQRVNPASYPETVVTPQTQPITIATWSTFQNASFSFKYPADWKISTSSSSAKLMTTNTAIISNFTPTASTSARTDSASINILNVKMFDKNGKALNMDQAYVDQRFSNPAFIGPKQIKLDSQDVATYTTKGNGPTTNYLILVFDGDQGSYYEISFDYGSGTPLEYINLFDQILKTFKFAHAQ